MAKSYVRCIRTARYLLLLLLPLSPFSSFLKKAIAHSTSKEEGKVAEGAAAAARPDAQRQKTEKEEVRVVY